MSSVWAKSALTDAAGNATFTFPVGFFDASPIISADIENTSPTTLYNRAVTAHTKDSVVIAVRSYVVTLGVLSLSVPAAGLQVNLIARRASP